MFTSIAQANSREFGTSLDEEIQSQLDNPQWLIAQNKKRSKKRSSSRSKGVDLLTKAKKLAVDKRYEESSKLLFSLTRSSRYRRDSSQIKYILGLMLMEMGLYQVSSFVFYDVINGEVRSGKTTRYLRQSLGKLSFLSNALDSDVLLKYTISKIRVKDFPREQKDLFYFRLGELRLKEKRYLQAAKIFSRVEQESPVYSRALYKQGLAYAEARQGAKALASFDELYNISKNKPITDTNRVNAILAMARVYYQNKKWDKAIEYYRNIPRDTWQWHDSLFEQSWAMLRSGRYFRSALSNFHTLHSAYYEDIYAPESLLLRGMVYLFICRYDEMGKVLNLFDRVYKPVEMKIRRFVGSASTASYLDEIIKGEANYQAGRRQKEPPYNTRLPKLVLNKVINQPNIRRNLNYIEALSKEKQRMENLSTDWRASGIGQYAKRVIDKRIVSTKNVVAKQAKNYLRGLKSELRDFFEQSDFLKFEMISGKKEAVRKKIAGKGIEKKQITDEESRDFFIGNGYEYWPYQGEYWLDELGNYHYVGVQACE
ncbi:MAG: tetratricopeptide repeat protein [Bdellovibrionales bacterium]|nr:tetratricopeptide repeat protein [Bdellovibrionales bacterium]